MKFNHEDHEKHKDKVEFMTGWCLHELRALRGEIRFKQTIKFKEIKIKRLD